METPLALTYRPVFPTMQSMFAQMGQMRALKEKQAAEERKTAESRAYTAASDLAKYHPDRPYVHSIETYFQTQAKQQFEIMNKVRKGELPPDAAYDHMMRMQADADSAKRYDAEVTTFMGKWKDSGNRDMQYITRKYGNHTVDLNATQQLGMVAWLPPSAVDPNGFVNDTESDVLTYNATALSQKFIADLERTSKTEKENYDPASAVISKSNSLPDEFFDPIPGSAGQSVLKTSAPGTPMSKTLLRRFRSLGTDFDNYLQLRSVAENPKFSEMAPESDEWGLQMQKSLQGLMQEKGFIGKTESQTALKPSEADTTNKFDKGRIGFTEKNEALSMEGADFVHRVLNQDQRALSFFVGPNIASVGYTNTGKLKITPKQGQIDKLAEITASINGATVDKAEGVVYVPNSRNGIAGIVNMKNSQSSGPDSDWNSVWVEKAYNQKYPESKKAPAAAKPKDQTLENQKRDLKEQLTPNENIIDLSDAPSDDDLDAFIQEAPVGTVIRLKDGTVKAITEADKKKKK